MLVCLNLHVWGFMPCFPMFYASFSSRLTLGLHAHTLVSCLWLCLAKIYMFVCMFYAPIPMSMPSHACMLEFVFSHTFKLTSTCLDVYSHAHMPISMVICVDRCVYMLRSIFSTCFIPSSMFLHASRHAYALRPRSCLSCHVLL